MSDQIIEAIKSYYIKWYTLTPNSTS
jgi:hypothetical protein